MCAVSILPLGMGKQLICKRRKWYLIVVTGFSSFLVFKALDKVYMSCLNELKCKPVIKHYQHLLNSLKGLREWKPTRLCFRLHVPLKIIPYKRKRLRTAISFSFTLFSTWDCEIRYKSWKKETCYMNQSYYC